MKSFTFKTSNMNINVFIQQQKNLQTNQKFAMMEEHKVYFRSPAHFITLAYISTHLKTMFVFLSMKHATKKHAFSKEGKIGS